MMTWILGNIVKQIESGTESWRAESRGGKSLTPFHFSAEGSTVFAPGVGLKNFTAIYRSTFRPTDSGAATFRVMTNGGVLPREV